MAHKKYQYCVAENWGKGFIDYKESSKINFVGYPGNIWRLPIHNKDANIWISKVLGQVKTLQEAQALVDEAMTITQTTWDNNNVDGETAEEKKIRIGERPQNVILEE
jgi:hypothetical protein